MRRTAPVTVHVETPEVHTITVEELTAALQDEKSTTKILDVRTDLEFAAGRVAGARHEFCDELLDGEAGEAKAREVLGALAAEGAQKVVILCMYSSGRGPAVAQSLASVSAENGLGLEVALLEGGFHKFINSAIKPDAAVGDVPGMIEGVHPPFWRRTNTHGLVEAAAVTSLETLGAPAGEDGGTGVQPSSAGPA